MSLKSLCFKRTILFLFCVLHVQEELIDLDLKKPVSGGLGFSVIGGERGIFVKSITPGGVAENSGRLQVGDRLLKVDLGQLWTHYSPCTLMQYML